MFSRTLYPGASHSMAISKCSRACSTPSDCAPDLSSEVLKQPSVRTAPLDGLLDSEQTEVVRCLRAEEQLANLVHPIRACRRNPIRVAMIARCSAPSTPSSRNESSKPEGSGTDLSGRSKLVRHERQHDIQRVQGRLIALSSGSRAPLRIPDGSRRFVTSNCRMDHTSSDRPLKPTSTSASALMTSTAACSAPPPVVVEVEVVPSEARQAPRDARTSAIKSRSSSTGTGVALQASATARR